MAEDKGKKSSSRVSNFQKILQERERLDQILQQEFRKEVVILFSDICGYTAYIDARGDISGRALLLKHNTIIAPLIEEHNGKVIEMIGDAVMACFSHSQDAVKASIAIQKAFASYNKKAEEGEQIFTKMGIHLGKVLVDEDASYQALTGDVVNVASRIQSEAGREQILLSKAVYERVCTSEDILCRFLKTVQVKGKAQPLDLYQVIWHDKDVLPEPETHDQTHDSLAKKRGKRIRKLLQLEITLQGDHLKLSAHEKTTNEEITLGHYEELPVCMNSIKAKCLEMVDTLNQANRQGYVAHDILIRFKEIGCELYDRLFSTGVKEKLKTTQAEYLSLKIDDRLVHIPWELLNDGQMTLCQRFHMGRLIKTRQPLVSGTARVLARPLKMLILADPDGDLEGAYAEGTQIRDYMRRNKGLMCVTFHSGRITPDSLKDKLRNFDFVHFAGHADYNPQSAEDSGWRLANDSLKARDIITLAGTSTMPALIFSNACQSARTEEWILKPHFGNEIFGMANAFLLAGVRHYIGTFWEVSDEQSSRFAREFYQHVLSNMTIGEAVRQSRLSLIKQYGEENIVWASYVLYGDPSFNYRDQIEEAKVREKPESCLLLFGHEVKKNHFWLSVTAGFVLLTTALLWGYHYSKTLQGTKKHINSALIWYNQGNFEQAARACRILERQNSRECLPYLIEGNICLTNGELDMAEAAYRKAIQAPHGTDVQKAQVLIGLGRIASLRKQTDAALNYYQQASRTAPWSSLGYLSQALLLEGQGYSDQALNLFRKAQSLTPQDMVLKAIIEEVRRKTELARDHESRERIDHLVQELLDSMDSSSSEPIPPTDEWTSFPLTLWIMDIEVHGYSLQEGQERLLTSGIIDYIINHSRAQAIERVLLDKVMEELKIGTSRLTDRNMLLSLGKMSAARLILSGQMVYAGPQVQISMRLIETETGRIVAALNQSFGSAVPVSLLAERLAKNIEEKFNELYPLRGKVSPVENGNIRLDIGQLVGVKKGQKLKVIDSDVILEITSVQKTTSLAKICQGEIPLQKSLRVEGI